jgi:hypothetical protein
MGFSYFLVIGILVGFGLLAFGAFRAATERRASGSERTVPCNECIGSSDTKCSSECGMPT